jgi:hypothetical protein
MTILQQLFYFGWLKVAEVLLNPLGEDDEDLETNFVIDRNKAIAMEIVDNNGFFPIQGNDPLRTNSISKSDKRNSHTLVGSASQLVLNENNDDHSGFGGAALRLRETLQRR